MNNYDGMIPASLKECYETDEVTRSLLDWSKNILIWGKLFLFLILLCGVVLSIFPALEKESFSVFVISFLPYLLVAVGEQCVFKFISYVIYVVASFHENSAIVANVALYQAAKQEKNL